MTEQRRFGVAVSAREKRRFGSGAHSHTVELGLASALPSPSKGGLEGARAGSEGTVSWVSGVAQRAALARQEPPTLRAACGLGRAPRSRLRGAQRSQDGSDRRRGPPPLPLSVLAPWDTRSLGGPSGMET